MTYTPGTKLSYADGYSRCTVVTRGRVYVTMVNGESHWEKMRLDDWLILAEGCEQTDFIPLPHADEDMVEAQPVAQPEPVPTNTLHPSCCAPKKAASPFPTTDVKYNVGTKLKWIHTDNDETYRVAIVTNDGVLQVKSVTDGGGDCSISEYGWRSLNKKQFPSVNAWLQSLPTGGNYMAYDPQPHTSDRPLKTCEHCKKKLVLRYNGKMRYHFGNNRATGYCPGSQK